VVTVLAPPEAMTEAALGGLILEAKTTEMTVMTQPSTEEVAVVPGIRRAWSTAATAPTAS